MKKLIAQGAESKVYSVDKIILKHRFKKSYRIKYLDEKIRSSRTKREAKVLIKLEAINFPAPKLLDADNKETLILEKIKGKLLRDVLEKEDYVKLCKEIGEKVAILHNNNIIHGDLTTSNMILNKKVYFIDFGLSFFSHKIEDMAVDLHLLVVALESKHYKIWEKCSNEALNSYEKKAKKGKDIIKRLKIVESRGRYKGKK